MCNEIVELVEEVEEGRVFTVEDGGIWFSGMNAHVGRLASSVASRLREEGYGVGVPRSDNAAEFGGLYLPVEEATEDREEDPMSRARRRSREKRQRSGDDAGLLRRLVRRILP